MKITNLFSIRKLLVNFQIVPCQLALYVDASDETMKKRLLGRGQGRVDDNEDTIKQRLKVFHQVTQPVIEYYGEQGKLVKINAEQNPDKVFTDIKKVIDKHNSKYILSKIQKSFYKAILNLFNS